MDKPPNVACVICTNDRGHAQIYIGQPGFPINTPAVAVPRTAYDEVRKMLTQITELAEPDSKNGRRAALALALMPEVPHGQ